MSTSFGMIPDRTRIDRNIMINHLRMWKREHMNLYLHCILHLC